MIRRREFLGYLSLAIGTATLSYGSQKLILPAKAAMPAKGERLPEFQGISQWLNTAPLTVANLKGNVILVQFWTLGCINCQRTLPAIVQWHQKYASKGLNVIGVHTPEFPFERDINNVKQALKKHQITYPVAIDNEFQTWNAYNNQYWPHLFLADRQGIRRYDHIGEGAYDQTEQTIRQLLGS
jgi:thiol-disulfide isomerase/thioredoxin